ncbi:MAG: NUDIX hydrolase [Candidatus Bathyarchaeia archaeon]
MSRLYPNRPIVGVGAIIIQNGKILLEKRKNDPGRGKWSIPGGLVELGESLEETVIREVQEETGLVVDAPKLIDVVSQATLDESGKVKYHFVIVDYLVKLKGGTVRAASDAAELEWVPFDEVEQKDLIRSFRGFFEKNRKRLEKMISSSGE